MTARTWSGPSAYRLVPPGIERSLLEAEVGVAEYQWAPAPAGAAVLLPLLAVDRATLRVVPIIGAARATDRLGKPTVKFMAVRADGVPTSLAYRDAHLLLTLADGRQYQRVTNAVSRVAAALSGTPRGDERDHLLRRMLAEAATRAKEQGADECLWRPMREVARAPVGERAPRPEDEGEVSS